MPEPTFDVYESEVDGVTVAHVDTGELPENELGPVIRIYLNDTVLYENPKFPKEKGANHCDDTNT